MRLKSTKWGYLFDVASLEARVDMLTQKTYEAGFWDDGAAAQKVLKETKEIKIKTDGFRGLEKAYEEALFLIQMAKEEGEEGLLEEIDQAVKAFEAAFEGFSAAILLDGEYDNCNVILSLHAGAGGDEACDWVAMLLRMYTRWAEAKGYTANVIDHWEGTGVGMKSATLEIIGPSAYGFLKGEAGVHRLIRISPFDSAGKRHTSFASCSVLPEVEDDVDIAIASDDLRVDTYRASGAGGQHVNKTDSAIRITHLPTGIVVQCQNERSQQRNREIAMRMLKAKLVERKLQEQNAKINDLRGDLKDIGFGGQIRTYTFHPYNLVKDHRTGAETGNGNAVMDGNLDVFVNGYLHWLKKS